MWVSGDCPYGRPEYQSCGYPHHDRLTVEHGRSVERRIGRFSEPIGQARTERMCAMSDTSTQSPVVPRRSMARNTNNGDPAFRRDPAGLRVVVADDSVLMREGVMLILEQSGVEVVGQAGDPDDLLRKVRAHKPDVAVVDVRMPPTHTNEGLRAAVEIRNELPDVGVLVLSQFVEDSYASELLAESAKGFGYLLKDRVVDVDRFLEALLRVANGGSALDPEIVSRLIGGLQSNSPLDSLTKRELTVLALMAEGRTNDAIAQELVVSRRAAEKHVTNIFQKLNLAHSADDHRRVLAVLTFLRARQSPLF